MANPSSGGSVLTVADIDEMASRIDGMWTTYSSDRTTALARYEEIREYLYAVDVDSTSASILPHKNRTHQPKLAQISDNLQSQYWEATMSMPQFFKFDGSTDIDQEKAFRIEAWIRAKLEARKFRTTVGRQLLADYTNFGNCFASIDYIVETNDAGALIYKGPDIKRISPLDIVMNPRARNFKSSPKLTRLLVHVADLRDWPQTYPTAGFKPEIIDKVVTTRQSQYINDWTETIKENGLSIDGFSSYDQYFKQDMVEVIIYRGDIFNPDTGESQRNRIVYVVDRMHVIRNEPNRAPRGFDGVHHAGWRVRTDNLWAQGPLENIIGMQYRIDHLENLKADIFDQIAQPVIVMIGENVQEPSSGWAPGASYRGSTDESVTVLRPDATALRASNEVALYHRMMEEFAGAPPETAGIRTPGEKTAFEVGKLDANATKMFVDKARNFELLIETLLEEAYKLMVINFDGVDYMEVFDDVQGKMTSSEIRETDLTSNGSFVAVGAQHWSRRHRETVEMQQFQAGPMQDPKIRAHVNGQKLAEFYEKRLGLQEEGIIEAYAGIKEDVHIKAVAEAEMAKFQKQQPAPADGAPPDQQQGDAQGQPGNDPGLVTPLQPSLSGPQANPVTSTR